MRDVYIDLTVVNDSDLQKQREFQLLADMRTQATRAWISEDIARELDIRPIGRVPLELASGEVQELPYGLCKFEYEGELVNGTVVIGPKGI